MANVKVVEKLEKYYKTNNENIKIMKRSLEVFEDMSKTSQSLVIY